jgi:8-oxo-dGTP pyrophosphatase MutT (NUDIX family)
MKKKCWPFLSSKELQNKGENKMGISVANHNLHISLTILLLHRYRGSGVAVFRINNGQPEVLLGLRANNPGRGTWSFPGGRAEGEERLISAAVREFGEETGVQLYRRYITKTGIFHIKNGFFEWNTFIIESTQDIPGKNSFMKRWTSGCVDNDGEFLSLRWVSVSEIGGYKLHRWVKDVINFYLSGKMTSYTPKPDKAPSATKRGNRVKTIRRETGESLLSTWLNRSTGLKNGLQ